MSCPFSQKDLEALYEIAVPQHAPMDAEVRLKLSKMVTHKLFNFLQVLRETTPVDLTVIRTAQVKQSIVHAEGVYLVPQKK